LNVCEAINLGPVRQPSQGPLVVIEHYDARTRGVH
jgi:hypothetical protein